MGRSENSRGAKRYFPVIQRLGGTPSDFFRPGITHAGFVEVNPLNKNIEGGHSKSGGVLSYDVIIQDGGQNRKIDHNSRTVHHRPHKCTNYR